MRFFSNSISAGNAATRFQAGMRSRAFMMSSIIPMAGSFADGACESRHFMALGPAALFLECRHA
ncbi:hypothetical protein CAL14_08370 [Bordetella genomosp. 9]|nr:hypothetical protein CAL14_08370 [Bordetella genomosp. 9]